jgi:hypothetical protein
VAKNPSPTTPSGGSTIFELLIVLYFELENLNHEPYKLILIQFIIFLIPILALSLMM